MIILKKFFQLLKSFYLYFKNPFRFLSLLKLKKINKKLKAGISDREVQKIILKGRIIKMVRKFLNINARSKYIPKLYKSNHEIINQIFMKFGPEMKSLNVVIKNDLTIL